jgi:hypothetical protein
MTVVGKLWFPAPYTFVLDLQIAPGMQNDFNQSFAIQFKPRLEMANKVCFDIKVEDIDIQMRLETVYPKISLADWENLRLQRIKTLIDSTKSIINLQGEY